MPERSISRLHARLGYGFNSDINWRFLTANVLVDFLRQHHVYCGRSIIHFSKCSMFATTPVRRSAAATNRQLGDRLTSEC
jgi:hypothetical protein